MPPCSSMISLYTLSSNPDMNITVSQLLNGYVFRNLRVPALNYKTRLSKKPPSLQEKESKALCKSELFASFIFTTNIFVL